VKKIIPSPKGSQAFEAWFLCENGEGFLKGSQAFEACLPCEAFEAWFLCEMERVSPKEVKPLRLDFLAKPSRLGFHAKA
jgi:hypothetical protein